MANSLVIGDIASWVVNRKMRRPELYPDAVDSASDIYMTIGSSVPFEAFEVTTSEVALQPNVATLDISNLDLFSVQSVRLSNNGQPVRRLKRSHVRVFDSAGSAITTSGGQPSSYARWGDQLEFFPTPNLSTYTIRIRGYQRPSIVLDSQGTPSATPITVAVEWNQLFKWETLFSLYMMTDEYEKAAMLVAPAAMPRYNSPKYVPMFETGILPRLWNDLLRTIKMREGGDEDFAINPLYRSYSAGMGGRR